MLLRTIPFVFIFCSLNFSPVNFLFAQKPTVKTIVIGKQIWMAENLDVDHFQNGDPIERAQSDAQWLIAGSKRKPAWCEDDIPLSKGEKRDKIYNWYVVNDQRKICPTGFHVPTAVEWNQLTAYLGGQEIAGRKMKKENGWQNNGNGNNASGFSAAPGGVRINSAIFSPPYSHAAWWSETSFNVKNAFYRSLQNTNDQLAGNHWSKSYGCFVRCLKDSTIK